MKQTVADHEAVVFECELPEPRDKVWRALTERDLLAQWLMPNDMRPEVGARFQLRPAGGAAQQAMSATPGVTAECAGPRATPDESASAADRAPPAARRAGLLPAPAECEPVTLALDQRAARSHGLPPDERASAAEAAPPAARRAGPLPAPAECEPVTSAPDQRAARSHGLPRGERTSAAEAAPPTDRRAGPHAAAECGPVATTPLKRAVVAAPVECEVLAVEPGRTLRWRQREPADAISPRHCVESVVTFELADLPGGGTHLRVVHDGFTTVMRRATVHRLQPRAKITAASCSSSAGAARPVAYIATLLRRAA